MLSAARLHLAIRTKTSSNTKSSSRPFQSTRSPFQKRWNTTNAFDGYPHVLRRPYEPSEIEPRWRKLWNEPSIRPSSSNTGSQVASSTPKSVANRKKYYALAMFPYPSGNLHIGHARVYTISDMLARAHKLANYDVLHPMGWDAFGLPAENAAIERDILPHHWTEQNIAHMKHQMKTMGLSFDWDKEISTCDPNYYKWTQWIFTKLYDAGLAYQKESYVNWDPIDMTVLANEQVDAQGKSWRSGALVEKKLMKQWYLKITDYAEPLLNDIDTLSDWPERVKKMQKEWIGKTEGSIIEFKINLPSKCNLRSTQNLSSRDDSKAILTADDTNQIHIDSANPKISVFTTRADTLLGCTYLVLAPENPIVKLICDADMQAQIKEFTDNTLKQDFADRTDHKKTKRGLAIGATATHPISGEDIPIYIADYVLADYATGAVMGVPAHDVRDHEFALTHNLPIKQVVRIAQPKLEGETVDQATSSQVSSLKDEDQLTSAVADVLPITKHGEGTELINSGKYNGMTTTQASTAIIEDGAVRQFAKKETTYNLRDWLVSRQRYWGAPIPIIHCEDCGPVSVPVDQLPVVLPTEGLNFKGKGSPLANIPDFVNCACPNCAKPARRETDTMDTFVDSSWYFMRYPDAQNDKMAFASELANKWLPVDCYVGGVEHAILHLLYARFINKFMHDEGLVPTSEPFVTLRTQGMVHGKTFRQISSDRPVKPELVDDRSDGAYLKETGEKLVVSWEKMSKSKYNGVDPIQVVEEYGADTIRLFLLFKAPVEQVLDWDTNQIVGQLRWIRRIWSLIQHYKLYQHHMYRNPTSEASSTLVNEQSSTSGTSTTIINEKLSLDKTAQDSKAQKELEKKTLMLRQCIHETVHEVTEAIFESHAFNVAIAKLMSLSNELADIARAGTDSLGKTFDKNLLMETPEFEDGLRKLIIMLAPMAPHFSSEAWLTLETDITQKELTLPDPQICNVLSQSWPTFNPEFLDLVKEDHVSLSIHISGKHRGSLEVPSDVEESSIQNFVLNSPSLEKWLKGKTIQKFVHVPAKKMINIVLK